MCDRALSFSLTLKIPVHGQQPSRASGTETKSQLDKVKAVQGSYIVKDTVGLNSAKVFLKAWL